MKRLFISLSLFLLVLVAVGQAQTGSKHNLTLTQGGCQYAFGGGFPDGCTYTVLEGGVYAGYVEYSLIGKSFVWFQGSTPGNFIIHSWGNFTGGFVPGGNGTYETFIGTFGTTGGSGGTLFHAYNCLPGNYNQGTCSWTQMFGSVSLTL